VFSLSIRHNLENFDLCHLDLDNINIITMSIEQYMTTRGKRGKERDRGSQTSTQNTQETPSRPVSTPTSSLSRPSPIAHPTSTPSTPTSSHSCVFDLRDDDIWYNGSKLKNVKYRARHSRVMDTNAKTSWIYQHGADIEAKEYPKLWLCKICHLSKRSGTHALRQQRQVQLHIT
jgi:hypothetical protein